ncbi:hypothetical protein [Campylobacter sp. RM12651]|uniref:hypothetical protein n=1 Tax=Campylobacter sp. RM12651 TaxID=1660079 RepID=UPI001EFB4102|nr:hypothetical protein [Campylobacter sp. RM12651]ULO04591.1 hypothetical protein AVBRAN_a0109 [Campylobacter sp. RM12651]
MFIDIKLPKKLIILKETEKAILIFLAKYKNTYEGFWMPSQFVKKDKFIENRIFLLSIPSNFIFNIINITNNKILLEVPNEKILNFISNKTIHNYYNDDFYMSLNEKFLFDFLEILNISNIEQFNTRKKLYEKIRYELLKINPKLLISIKTNSMHHFIIINNRMVQNLNDLIYYLN